MIEKKLVKALFIDVKKAFNYVLRNQVFKCIIELDIDRDLITWTRFFLSNRKIRLVIDRHENKKREIETGILQRLFVLLILFLIYINGVFDLVSKTCFLVLFLLFINN